MQLFWPCHEGIEGGWQLAWDNLFLTPVQDGGEWSATCSNHFTHGERTSGTHGIGGWIDLRISIDILDKRK